MRFADIRLVIGTRPEAIKLKPIAQALAARAAGPTLVFTGQHVALDPKDFGLGDYASINLGCPGEEDPHSHVRKVSEALLAQMRSPPDLVVVQGDTSSALGGALAAFVAGVPVAHVEAGLRTHDLALPWPEEEYRTAIDDGAALLFAPTALAAANLAAEKVAGEVHVTGNTAVDSLLAVESRLPAPSLRETGPPRLLVTCHRRESWGEGLAAIASALATLAASRPLDIEFVLHPNPFVAGQMRSLLGGVPGTRLIPPCGHAELVRRMRDADLILSDSGGIQEETPALGVPLLVLREKTERPEGIASGNALLVGTSVERIVAEATRLLDDPLALAAMSRRTFPYGDGRAAERIAAIVEDWLQRRQGGRKQA